MALFEVCHSERSVSRRLAACLLVLFLASFARAERLPLRTYTVADGLAHNVINRIVRDSRGFLWFCTADGLSRFDGYEFTNYGTSEGLPHPYVNDFLETRNGEFWLATNGGLVRFNPRGVAGRSNTSSSNAGDLQPLFSVVVPEDPDRRARAITVLFEDHNGWVWCGTMNGLYRLDAASKSYRLVPVEIGLPLGALGEKYISDVLEDRQGSLWIATPIGLYRRWPDGSFAHYAKRDGLPGEHLHDLFMDHSGRLWAATRQNGFFNFSADETHKPPVVIRAFGMAQGLPANWVFELFESSDRRFWIATSAGLAEFLPQATNSSRQFRLANERNGLAHHDITTLNQDLDGNLWIGSNAGAMKLAHNGFTTYDQADGIDEVNAVFQDRRGAVCARGWILGDGRRSVFEGARLDVVHSAVGQHVPRFGRFDGQAFKWLLPQALSKIILGWVGEGITLQDHAGEWWIGTAAGLYRFPATDDLSEVSTAHPLGVYDTKSGLGNAQIYRLFEDSRGDVWVSTIGSVNSLSRWERSTGTMHDLSIAAGLPTPRDDLARSFGEDGYGNVWIGFGTGLARYHDGNFTLFTASEGLPSGGIQQIHRDHAGRIWLASSRGGLIRMDDPQGAHPRFVSFTIAQGLSSNITSIITEDRNGNIYVGTGRGLDVLNASTGRIKHFTTADGLVSGSLNTAFADTSGTLWFGTGKGLSRFIPEADESQAAPPVLITRLSVSGAAQMISALGETAVSLKDFAASQNQMQIDFVGLSFAPGEVLRYQYKLDGVDRDWSAPTSQRTITFANLAPRHYRFLVRAVSSGGSISAVPAEVTFTILPPLWRRWWFVSLVLLVVSLMVYLLFRYRVARIVEVANIRTHIAADLHDDIGANLTRIAILSEVAHSQLGQGSPSGESPLLSIANISRESVASMSDIVWAINPKRDTLLDLIQRMRRFATEIFNSRGIEFEFRAPELDHALKLGASVRRDIFLVFKEALNNAVRHSDCTSASIIFEVERSGLVLTVRDNGRGFDTENGNEGQGLASMTRRARSLGGELVIDTKTGQGTEICLKVPRRTY